MNAHQLKCFMLNIFSDGQSASCVPSPGPPPHSAQVWQLSDRRLAPRNADDGVPGFHGHTEAAVGTHTRY